MAYGNGNIALMAHLMRRGGFGAPRAELEECAAKGYEATVEELVDPEKYGLPQNDEDLLFRHNPAGILPGGVTDPGQGNYMWQMVNTQRPLQEKMTLFWHHLFATGNAKIDNCDQMLAQINMLRQHALGNYRELLLEVSKNPAMIFWLDNNFNHKDEPNENWGRELLELFSMGQGNYTEKDVFECARAFTGWTISAKLPRFPYGRFPWAFEYRPEDHDDTEKEFLGQLGRFNGEDIIDIVVRQPATSRFIARHLYNFFVADDVQVPAWQHTQPRDPVAINQIGDAFNSSGYDMRETMRFIFNSDFFKEAMYQKVKSPAEVVVGTLNLVGDLKGRPRARPHSHRGGAQEHGTGPVGPPQRRGMAHRRRVDRQRLSGTAHQLRRRPGSGPWQARSAGHRPAHPGPGHPLRRAAGGQLSGLDRAGGSRGADPRGAFNPRPPGRGSRLEHRRGIAQVGPKDRRHACPDRLHPGIPVRLDSQRP